MTPQEFEQFVARIYTCVHLSQAVVTWDDRIPDPHNPAQDRQIDVTIRKSDRLTLVECRHRREPQDVRWIEELYGKKVGMGASAVIAVSSSGFTSGARSKAEGLGVFVRNLWEITAREVPTWGELTQAWLHVVELHQIEVHFVVPNGGRLPEQSEEMSEADGIGIMLLLKSLAIQALKSGLPEGPLGLDFLPTSRTFCGLPVVDAVVSATWRRNVLREQLPSLAVFESAGVGSEEEHSTVERSDQSRTEIHHTARGAVVLVDLSSRSSASFSHVYKATLDLGQPRLTRGMVAIGMDARDSWIGGVDIQCVRETHPWYREFRRRTPKT